MPLYPFAEWKEISGPTDFYTGGPFRIVHHTTEGPTARGAFNAYRADGSDPHFTVDDNCIYQHINTDRPARSLKHPASTETNNLSAIQIEVVGYAGAPKSAATIANVARLCRWIEKTHNVPREWPNGLPVVGRPPALAAAANASKFNGVLVASDPGGHNRDLDNWINCGGHYGHCHVPGNSHWDPGYTPREVARIMWAAPTSLVRIQAWVSAFIPGTIPGVSQIVPDGVHKGKTMVPGPPFTGCFLTDNRTFSPDPTAKARMHCWIDIDCETATIVKQTPNCDLTTEMDCATGAVIETDTADKSRILFANIRRDGDAVRVDLSAEANNPCVALSPDLEVFGILSVYPASRIVVFSGTVSVFPAYEMYACVLDETPKPLFKLLPPTGNTPLDLLWEGIGLEEARNAVGAVIL